MNRTRITTLGWRTAAVLAAAAGLAACADVPPPTAQLGASAQAVQTAERAGALQYAPAEYQSAREKLGAADTAMRNDDRTKARRLAEEAQVEADLATIRSQRATAQQAAGAVRSLAGPQATNTGTMPRATTPALPPATSGTSDWSVPRTPGGTP